MMGAAMWEFSGAAAVLAALALWVLLWPRRVRPVASRPGLGGDLYRVLYRDQLAELERDRAAGVLTESDHAAARFELERRLLEDVAGRPVDSVPAVESPAAPRSRRTAWALALALPLLAAALYAWRGTPQALRGPATREASSQVTPAQIERMLRTLQIHLQSHPEDAQGWAMLARSYRLLDRQADAEQAFARVGPSMDRDPALLAEYADVLAAGQGGRIDGRALELAQRALALDPSHPIALMLVASAASQRGDAPTALRTWQHLLRQLPPGSDEARAVEQALAEIRAGAAIPAQAAASAPTGAIATSAAASGAISGRVTLAPALAARLRPGDTLFVFARAVDGPRMPLAVWRTAASRLPVDFRLDDTLALDPDRKLSSAGSVRVEARVSRSGNAMPTSGDLSGISPPLRPGATGVQLNIDQVQP